MVSLVSNVNELDQIEELIRDTLFETYIKLKNHFPWDKVYGYEISTKAENELMKYALTVYIRIRDVQCIYVDAMYEDCSDLESEEEVERCVDELRNEYDNEYLVKPFEFKYEDTTFTIENGVDVEEDSVKRCYYDTLKLTYKNQVSIEFAKQYVRDALKKNEFIEKISTQTANELIAAINKFREILESLLPD